jgi:sporulation protein YlmC with PRC-barrel domain
VGDLRLVRAVLDNQVIDAAGIKLGKVDSVILVVDDGGPPRVTAIEIGEQAIAERLHPRLGRWLDAIARRLGAPPGKSRIPWARVTDVGREIQVSVDGRRTRAFALERWLRARVIGRIPGAG